MNDLRDSLKKEFADEDVRYAYAQSFLYTKIAAQIKTLREGQKKTQDEIAPLCGTKQAGFSRFEDVNHGVWKTDTLWKIARALGVRVNVSFETFGSLLDEKARFNREYLWRPRFEEDPAFSAQPVEDPALNGKQIQLVSLAEEIRQPGPISTTGTASRKKKQQRAKRSRQRYGPRKGVQSAWILDSRVA